MAERPSVLLLPLEGRLDDVTGRLLLVHFRGKVAPTLTDAERVLRTETPPIRVAMIPAQPNVADLPGVLAALRDAALGRALRFVALGAPPTPQERDALRAAKVDFALYHGFSDTELRFVLNAGVSEHFAERRDDLRVPTPLVAKLKTPAGPKVALVYSLSTRGAYLETTRPSQEGVRIEVELPLPSGALELGAVVVSTNVTGNLRRENLPRGMGVRFEELSSGAAVAVKRYLEERLTHLRP